ncbi:MAG: FAD-dependent oxidoreductase [Thermodesulfobacteriota bacterium]
MNKNGSVIIGGGVTGLAAGYVSNLPIYEAEEVPGGICSSYYLKAGETEPRFRNTEDNEAYRFEIGGGHWIFGGDPAVLHFIKSLTPVKSYKRSSAVYFPDENLYVPYPLQNNLAYLGKDIAKRAIREIENSPKRIPKTMEEWLELSFGKTLLKKFFAPFHDLYTAGLWTKIAPQDAYKSPINMNAVVNGASNQNPPEVGYNVTYLYPEEGLNTLASKMSDKCTINYGKRVVEIDLVKREVNFDDGKGIKYNNIISTLPLNKAVKAASLKLDPYPDDFTSVLVLNIGAKKGNNCPPHHWLYIPSSKSGFHRVGFYSNVDNTFLPLSSREDNNRVSIYIEKAFQNGKKPSVKEIKDYSKSVIDEIKEWGFISEAETIHPTWIDVAYTWAKPGSIWKDTALKELEKNDIFQIGRYGRWSFQGIAESIRDGFYSGSSFIE